MPTLPRWRINFKMKSKIVASRFMVKYRSLQEVMMDHGLAALGDAYVNLVYSLYLSRKAGKPIGKKVNSLILANALRMADLRNLLPSRTDRHKQADAVEALIVYAWIKGLVGLGESVDILERYNSPDEGFSNLLRIILERIKLGLNER